MGCVGFDIGTRNLAICRIAEPNTLAITHWTVVDLGIGTLTDQIGRLPDLLNALEMFQSDDMYAIEMQPPQRMYNRVTHGPNRSVAMCLMTYLRTRFAKCSVTFQHAGCTDKVIDETPGGSYKEKKLRAIMGAKTLLIDTQQRHWLNVYMATGKRDDLADAFLHATYRIRHNWEPAVPAHMNFDFLGSSA